MNKTTIEYCDYSWNPLTGCTKRCSYCYANRLAQGWLRNIYSANPAVAPGCDPSDPFSPRYWYSRLSQPGTVKRPSKIFTVDMGDLFDPAVPQAWIYAVLDHVLRFYWHTFIFLTKQPQRAAAFTFPPNAWAGVTVNNAYQESAITALRLKEVNATVRFFSIEPLLGSIPILPAWVNWVIVGAMTGSAKTVLEHAEQYPGAQPMKHNGKWTLQPHPDWVNTLLDEAARHGIKVFLKDNLDWSLRRTEWPRGIKP